MHVESAGERTRPWMLAECVMGRGDRVQGVMGCQIVGSSRMNAESAEETDSAARVSGNVHLFRIDGSGWVRMGVFLKEVKRNRERNVETGVGEFWVETASAKKERIEKSH